MAFFQYLIVFYILTSTCIYFSIHYILLIHLTSSDLKLFRLILFMTISPKKKIKKAPRIIKGFLIAFIVLSL